MADGRRQGPDEAGSEPSGATEPITLTDPDGAVTRVAPWSSWTREQVRAPGGEPALVTRLDQGQLWFAAGRRRSPWRHEVHVGPAVVSTPRGRFQATAESDGGATIACLSGRTRVVAGLREPVLLGPDQSAAVSSDGRTLVVMDRAAGASEGEQIIDLTDDVPADAHAHALESELRAEVPVAAFVGSWATPSADPAPAADGEAPEPADQANEPAPDALAPARARLGWVPELVAVAALIGLLVAAVWVLGRSGDDALEVTSPPATSALVPTTDAPTTEAPTTEAPTTTAETTTTEAPTTTTTTTEPRPSAVGAQASGTLEGCRRAEGGVLATVLVSHRSGPASTFLVTAALADDGGAVFAEAAQLSPLVDPGASVPVEVFLETGGPASGSCQLVGVSGG